MRSGGEHRLGSHSVPEPGETGVGRNAFAHLACSCRPGKDVLSSAGASRSGRIVSCRTLARNNAALLLAVRPLVSQLEDRMVLSLTLHQYLSLSQFLLSHPKVGNAYSHSAPPFLSKHAPRIPHVNRTIHAAAYQTIRGGQAVNVASVDGTHYRIQLGYISNTVATSAGDGAGGLYCSNDAHEPQPSFSPRSSPSQSARFASIPCRAASSASSLTGRIHHRAHHQPPAPADSQGLCPQLCLWPEREGPPAQYRSDHGYQWQHRRDRGLPLGRPVGTGPGPRHDHRRPHRLQFSAARRVDPDRRRLNTLDVLQGITLTTGTNIQVGRDLNLLNVGQNITLSGGSQILIGRDMGARADAWDGSSSS